MPLAEWKTPFDPSNTITVDFHVNENRMEMVPMMKAEDVQVLYFRDETRGVTVVQVPYRDSHASAFFVLPDQGRMAELEAALLPDTFQHWRDSLRTRYCPISARPFSLVISYPLPLTT